MFVRVNGILISRHHSNHDVAQTLAGVTLLKLWSVITFLTLLVVVPFLLTENRPLTLQASHCSSFGQWSSVSKHLELSPILWAKLHAQVDTLAQSGRNSTLRRTHIKLKLRNEFPGKNLRREAECFLEP